MELYSKGKHYIINEEIIGILNRKKNTTIARLNKPSYFHLRDLVWNVIIDNSIKELPINLYDICKNYGIALEKYSENVVFILKLKNEYEIDEDAFHIIGIKYKVIFYNDKKPITRQRYSVAHELGHILLKHKIDKDEQETEAQMFSARLLMPIIILRDCGAETPEEIAKLCNVSLVSATYRAERLNMLINRNKFFSPLEQKVRAQFDDFIRQKQSDV